MTWESDSIQPPITVKLYREERELIWDLLFDYYQEKQNTLNKCTDTLDQKRIQRELDMVVGLRHKMQMT